MINFNANVSSIQPGINRQPSGIGNIGKTKAGQFEFADTMKAVGKYVSQGDDLHKSSNMAVKDLLAGKTEDINTVVSAMAKADISFKLLVGVRNKLVEAYKQTMNMQI